MSIITTMKGKKIDIGAILAAQENNIAIGNANMNAKGDILGKGGAVIKKASAVSKEYLVNNPKAVKKLSMSDMQPSTVLSPADAMAEFRKRAEEARKIAEAPVQAEQPESIQDSVQEVVSVETNDSRQSQKGRRLVDK